MTVNDVLNYNQVFKSIIDNTTNVNALVKFKLLGMCKQFEPIIENFEKVRQDKIREFSNMNEGGNYGIIAPEKDKFENNEDFEKAQKEFDEAVEKFDAAIKEVTDSEVKIEIEKFKASDIIDAGIPADYLLAIYDLIEE